MLKWTKGIATDAKKRITSKYLIWRTTNQKPHTGGKNIVISKDAKYVTVSIKKKGWFAVLEQWRLGSKNKILRAGMASRKEAITFAKKYMRGKL